ncbi:unnamed protein product, partial [Ixodes pacificus]
MPFHCCVPLCKQKGLKDASGNKMSLFAFPSDPVVRKKWVIAIKRDEGKHFTITKYTKLCSGHFQQSDYPPNVAGNRRYLKQQAVPSVFAFNVSKKPPKKKPCERQPLPVVQRISIADDNVTSEALLKTVSEDAVGEAASREEASAVITDLTNEDTAEATIGPVANNASDKCACQTAARGPTDFMHMDRLQNLQKQTESQAKLVQDLELDLERYKEQLREAEDALSKVQSELCSALDKCSRFDDQEKELQRTKQALFKNQRELELALARCSALEAR